MEYTLKENENGKILHMSDIEQKDILLQIEFINCSDFIDFSTHVNGSNVFKIWTLKHSTFEYVKNTVIIFILCFRCVPRSL